MAASPAGRGRCRRGGAARPHGIGDTAQESRVGRAVPLAWEPTSSRRVLCHVFVDFRPPPAIHGTSPTTGAVR